MARLGAGVIGLVLSTLDHLRPGGAAGALAPYDFSARISANTRFATSIAPRTSGRPM